MRFTTKQKYIKIQVRYKELYDVKRIRHDDVVIQLAEEFFVSAQTVERVLLIEFKQSKK